MLAYNLEFSLLALIVLSTIQVSLGTLLGAALGWLLKAGRSSVPMLADDLDRKRTQHVNEALVQLQSLTTTVGENVGQHSKQVESISHDLNVAEVQNQGELKASVIAALASIKSANDQLQEQLHAAESKLQEQAERLHSQMVQARTDALTGLANRRAFDDSMNDCLDEFRRTTTPFCLMMIDVDHFKKFNDTHGHLAGDEVLRCVARALRESCQACGIVNRYGGEEFAILFPATSFDRARVAAEAARATIEATVCEFAGAKVKVTVSGGLALVRVSENAAGLIERADTALYAAKKAGRNRVYLHDGADCRSALPSSRPAPTEPLSAKTKEDAIATVELLPNSNRDQTDSLTGLPNQLTFEGQLKQRLAERRRTEIPVVVAVLDVDGMRALNATYSTAVGDKILKAITQFLKAALRETDLVARLNDDRFTLLLPSTKLNDASQVVERIRRAVERCNLSVGDREVRFTISIGVAAAKNGDDVQLLIGRATQALKTAKQAGQNCSRLDNGERVVAIEDHVSAEPALSRSSKNRIELTL